MALTVERELPDEDARDLLALTRDLVDRELAPRVNADEHDKRFPRDVYDVLAKTGLMGLAYPAEHGGGGQPYETYLQVLEEVAAGWLSVGIGMSVHTLATFPLATYGTAEQQSRWLPDQLEGRLLGAYCLSEPDSGSDAASLSTRAVLDGDAYVVTGTKAWITHGGVADFYNLMVRTSDTGPKGITCLLAEASTPGLSAAEPERKMAAGASPTAQILLDGARVPVERRIGDEGQGFSIALAALDSGRLGIAACSVGLAQAALDAAVAYAGERRQFGRPIADFQGLQFMLADMATQVAAARELYLAAARRRDRGQPFGHQAAMAKLFASDTAMRVTTDAVQVLGGYGYVEDFPLERYMREAKVLQIVEGTNQIQRVVIARGLLG
jgi:alkylation response protein AidB-like acyl-CoA dehydrogenase